MATHQLDRMRPNKSAGQQHDQLITTAAAHARLTCSIDTLIFDLDGTLVDTGGGIRNAINLALDQEGLAPLTAEEVTHRVGQGGTALVEYGLLKSRQAPDPQRIAHLQENYFKHYLSAPIHATSVYPGVFDMLNRFSSLGVNLAICTNKASSLASAVIDGLGLAHYFKNIVYGDSLPHRKPHAHPIEWIVNKACTHADACVMIGDTENDVLAARNAGVFSIFVNFGYGKLESLETCPDSVIDHFDDLEPALHKIGLKLSEAISSMAIEMNAAG
ncbi:MAG: HAD-IA family hydrolase [Pseudomonadota bacterium]|nr:HAD-IA family hydrolase [Pseudomonadota bacterium]